MRFITVQAVPQKQWVDEDGNHHSELCMFNEATVKVKPELGFAPMWAIPITTFKETLASMLLIAANYPAMVCVFETDDYKIVDKIQHYQNIKQGERVIPIAPEGTPTHLTEYVLDLKKLPKTPTYMARVDIEKFIGMLDKYASSDNPSFMEDALFVLQRQLERMPDISDESFDGLKDMYPENYRIRIAMAKNWHYYKHLVLPILLHALCEDTNPQIKDGALALNIAATMSVMHNIHKFLKLENELSVWSHEDCSQEKFEEIYQKTKDAIIQNPEVLELLASGVTPERNKPCPCGSQKKYKKCHGQK